MLGCVVPFLSGHHRDPDRALRVDINVNSQIFWARLKGWAAVIVTRIQAHGFIAAGNPVVGLLLTKQGRRNSARQQQNTQMCRLHSFSSLASLEPQHFWCNVSSVQELPVSWKTCVAKFAGEDTKKGTARLPPFGLALANSLL
jgi:hypothetical protein